MLLHNERAISIQKPLEHELVHPSYPCMLLRRSSLCVLEIDERPICRGTRRQQRD